MSQGKDSEHESGDTETNSPDVELTVAAGPDEEASEQDTENSEEAVFENSEEAASASNDFAGSLVGRIYAERNIAAKLVDSELSSAFEIVRATAFPDQAGNILLGRLISAHKCQVNSSDFSSWGSLEDLR
jgi:hypothetical protein